MKKLLPISFVLSIALLSCGKGKATAEPLTGKVETKTNSAGTFTVDSLKVNDTLKVDENLTLKFQSKILVFPSIKNKAVLDSIYAVKEIHLAEYSKANLTEALNQKKQNYFDEQKKSLKDLKPEVAQNWENNSDMSLFSHDHNFLTIKYSGDGYTGGAHGYYFEKYKVFDLKNNKTIQLTDIISNKDLKLWDRILMDNFIQHDAEKGQAEMLLVKTIPLNTNFYFDKEFLYFLYNQYEITAYAAGTVLIKIPLSDIKPLLTDEFIDRQEL